MKKPIRLKGVAVHNLQSVDVEIEQNELIVCTGVSGSGKSSFAFDTLFVEGQRRYVESLSTYARRQLGNLHKPELQLAENITPTISIEQKTIGRSRRSTVGTLTEIYDFLRVLFARVAIPHCPISQEPLLAQSSESIFHALQALPKQGELLLLAPIARAKKATFKEELAGFARRGFLRARIDGEIRRIDQELALAGNQPHDVDIVVDRIKLSSASPTRVADSAEQTLEIGEGTLIADVEGKELFYSKHAKSRASGKSYPALEPNYFSFNSPYGMCERCQGIGSVVEFDLDKIIDAEKSIAEDCCSIASSATTVRYGNIYRNLAEIYHFSLDIPWKNLPKKAKEVFLYGTGKKRHKMLFTHPTKGMEWVDYLYWDGVLKEAYRRLEAAKSASYKAKMAEWMHDGVCPECRGARLKAYPLAARLGGLGIAELTSMSIGDAQAFFRTLSLTKEQQSIAEDLCREIEQRLHFLCEVGLHYLTLHRSSTTLSGGEAQRVRLASQVGSALTGVTYVLDEPSIGLHPRDNKKLVDTVLQLRDRGNTVVVVEHDEEMIRAADHIIDFGPGAGKEGGQIVFSGSLKKLLQTCPSLTAQFLRGDRNVAEERKRRERKGSLLLQGASLHNLRNVTLQLPLNCFVAVTGVSGSGKSSLIIDTLYPALQEKQEGPYTSLEGREQIQSAIVIDQSPIGRNPRSTPATYIGLLADIRTLFCQLPQAKARGFAPGRFSFNVPEGCCSHCHGMGQVKIDMDFLEDAWVECSSCQGRRFDSDTLQIHYNERNIFDILEMSVKEALVHFADIPVIRRKLTLLDRVGLGYVKLGQSSTTLSGGEAQRVKIAKELVKRPKGDVLYLLDEPTTGLHFADIEKLLSVLHSLVDHGHTVLVIEHQMDVVSSADWVIDLGPDGGKAGGKIIAEGPPEEIAKKRSFTGAALRERGKQRKRRSTKRKEVSTDILVEGAEQNNLKKISATIPRHQITLCTGPSGAGKSSFAYETLYAEGQRRYIDSLSTYARQFVKQMPKPKVGQIHNIPPAVALEPKPPTTHGRSTVGTMTETYDFLRILFARIGTAHCPETGEVIEAISKEHVVERLGALPAGQTITILADISPADLQNYRQEGYLRVYINGKLQRLDEPIDGEVTRCQLVLDRIKLGGDCRMRLFEAVGAAASIGHDRITALQEGGEELFFNLRFTAPSTGKSYPEVTPRLFLFNTAEGMCPECYGMGTLSGVHLAEQPLLLWHSLLDLLKRWWRGEGVTPALEYLLPLLAAQEVDPTLPLRNLSKKQLSWVLQGGEGWRGLNQVLSSLLRAGRRELRELISLYASSRTCTACQGSRLQPLARHVLVEGHSLPEVCAWPIHQAEAFFQKLQLPEGEERILGEVLAQIRSRLRFLQKVGLGYLALDRKAPTLSGGESQRIRLAKQLGGGLNQLLYVLDEPTSGLHPRDIDQLREAIEELRGQESTIVIVDHAPQMREMADHVLEFGPGAGKEGGKLGTFWEGKSAPPLPTKRRGKSKKLLSIRGASVHNLQHIDVDLPLHRLVAITGVSGAGKSSLAYHTLYKEGRQIEGAEQVDRMIYIDQAPPGTTARADVATYSRSLEHLRDLFCQLPQAKALGLDAPGYFSYNSRLGMCHHCHGLGYSEVELQFLPPVRITCPECTGYRLSTKSLAVTYEGRHLGQHLQGQVSTVQSTFSAYPKLQRVLDTLCKLGLGYLPLSQQVETLSGGEAQRLKLARDLAKERGDGHTLYILDEPCSGLHFSDLIGPVALLQELVDAGNSVIIVEHRMEVVNCADFILELGPGPGAEGGKVVSSGYAG